MGKVQTSDGSWSDAAVRSAPPERTIRCSPCHMTACHPLFHPRESLLWLLWMRRPLLTWSMLLRYLHLQHSGTPLRLSGFQSCWVKSSYRLTLRHLQQPVARHRNGKAGPLSLLDPNGLMLPATFPVRGMSGGGTCTERSEAKPGSRSVARISQ